MDYGLIQPKMEYSTYICDKHSYLLKIHHPKTIPIEQIMRMEKSLRRL